MSMLEYSGYVGSVEYSAEDHCLYGKLEYIRDLVNYEAKTVEELEFEFKAAVDDYLLICERKNKVPNKPFKGVFNIRTGTTLHRAAVIASGGQSLNAFVCDAIQEKLNRIEA